MIKQGGKSSVSNPDFKQNDVGEIHVIINTSEETPLLKKQTSKQTQNNIFYTKAHNLLPCNVETTPFPYKNKLCKQLLIRNNIKKNNKNETTQVNNRRWLGLWASFGWGFDTFVVGTGMTSRLWGQHTQEFGCLQCRLKSGCSQRRWELWHPQHTHESNTYTPHMHGSPVLTQYTQESLSYKTHGSPTPDLKHTQESGRTHLGIHSAVRSQDAHSTNGCPYNHTHESDVHSTHGSPDSHSMHGSPTLAAHTGVRSL